MIRYEIREYFAEYVYRQMIDRDIRPWYIAYYAETNESSFRSYLKKKGLPRIDSLIMIAELLECSVNELLGYESIELEPRDYIFDSGRDVPQVAKYFISEIDRRSLDVHAIKWDIPMYAEELERSIRFNRLTSTDIFLQVCDFLDCTPSELLGY